MLLILGREVEFIISEESRAEPGNRNSPMGIRCFLKGDAKPRWVSYDCVEWRSIGFDN